MTTKSGFHTMSKILWQERINSSARKPKKPTEDGKRQAEIRRRREELEEEARLNSELKDVWS